MSIEMENPKTLLEIVDAAANHVSQCSIALMVGSREHMEIALREANRLLLDATCMIEKSESK